MMETSAKKGSAFVRESAQTPSAAEAALRPKAFADFTGQKKTIERLEVMTGAARKRGSTLNHILFSGPPGLGKTTLAHILGEVMEKSVHITSGPVIDRPGDLAGMLTNLQEGDLLFIDEIHRTPRAVEEYLYSAMEDFRIDILLDQGPNARSVRLDIPRFTLVGATTRMGLLTAPLRSRFTLQTRLDYYDIADLVSIIHRSCHLLSVQIDRAGAVEIASRARGTPRVANNLVYFVRDYAEQRGNGQIDQAMASAALELLEIDTDGLDEMDKRILEILARNYNGGPAGLNSIAVAVGEEQHTIEEVHEPFLIKEGFLQRTAQGRVLTDRGWKKSGCLPPKARQLELGDAGA